MASLTINNAVKRYGTVEVLKGVSIDLQDGEFLVLLGASGCGKSTLLNMIAGLESVTEGEISIGGRVVNDVHPKDRDIAMVFQSYALYPTMTVAQNIAFGLEMRGMPKAERKERVLEVAKMLQMDHLLDRKPGQLSGGQRQRVAMGRALVRDPEVFLFDEPLSNLDAKLRLEMRTEIKRLHKRLNATMVYVTHDQIEALTLADRIAILKDGEVQQLASPAEIYEQPANMFVAGLVGSPPMNFIEVVPQPSDRGPVAEITVRAEGVDQTVVLDLSAHAAQLEGRMGQKLVLGLRPEMITQSSIAASGQVVPCEIDVTEATGADTLCVLTWNGKEVLARGTSGYAMILEGTMDFAISLERAVLFDPQTGARLG
ncbi:MULTISPECIES: ABC transporter ATP-binding protein [Rhodobacterales]|uniref:ABC transporter ATP-binding protein n=1 Tax=Rhodobacterales TaxID=204455 RepID=UPI00237F44D9|nr:sn-glycerol-3-phosphate ABC transporter ATP-binding protein UgpC [Phaeobacter gallaeciensis]MDE4097583.1 sn-glycerol-3-phosphate ABC transporter ATP-binding protein UgpC [Phaeobacter gallaeciensis]MDE4106579.1 sn-glycerol-3-phosphate ABC transporter ATP-binding protein UgpC [Phaeobacter gallaeciensis]MDE4110847.1 sn-glycerol-3-phosphate ABC transporter ATP-binding protein UgpC [Phaeobacter gallaeciensis]MDE4115504.1 sn-glycerol-3-phosphate ABC transporter ATP-binding protein UgpC [Phaeobacte